MSNKRIKVTDRRMFTPEGELRDDYKELGKEGAKPAEAAAPKQPEPPREPPPKAEKPVEDEPLPSGAVFQDLVALLAQSASVYFAQAAQRIESRAELLEMARMHVDLLEVLKRKTRGNLDPRDQAMLDDALYQLRMAFVQQG